jgi:HEAT repeat protein
MRMTASSFRDRPNIVSLQEANRLVRELQNLQRGPLVLPDIVACGEIAVPALEAALRGPSQALHHSRSMAADALGAIGGEAADAALARALMDSTSRTLNPVFQEAEAVVVSRIVTHLSRHQRRSATDALLESMRLRPGPACAQALGELGDPRAIPLLVRSLGEDAAREAAMDALRRFGRAPVLRLHAALARPHLVGDIEPPTSVDARAAAAVLLGELGECAPLLLALEDRARLVRVAAAMSLLQMPDAAPLTAALEILVDGLGDPNWAIADAVMDVLARHSAAVTGMLEKQLEVPGDDDASLRRHRRAAILAGRLGIAHAASILARLSDATDPALRFAAIHALTQIPSTTDDELTRFLADPVLSIALEALRALRVRRPYPLLEVSRQLKASRVWRTPWRRWRRLWALRTALTVRGFDQRPSWAIPRGK